MSLLCVANETFKITRLLHIAKLYCILLHFPAILATYSRTSLLSQQRMAFQPCQPLSTVGTSAWHVCIWSRAASHKASPPSGNLFTPSNPSPSFKPKWLPPEMYSKQPDKLIKNGTDHATIMMKGKTFRGLDVRVRTATGNVRGNSQISLILNE
jgi:hypothetical protein